MKYYQELTLLPDMEVELYYIWSKLYTQIHLALVEMQDEQGNVPVGVSFPEYAPERGYASLGKKMRLFAHDEATLAKLNLSKWLNRLNDYVHCTKIRTVPEKIEGYAAFQRYRTKTNAERLARRYAKRNDVSLEEAMKKYKGFKDDLSTLPFVRIKSQSNQNLFRLMIDKRTVKPHTGNHCFSSYGLSTDSSVPEF